MSARAHREALDEHAGGDAGLHRLEQMFYEFRAMPAGDDRSPA
jgi:hypothetical protein